MINFISQFTPKKLLCIKLPFMENNPLLPAHATISPVSKKVWGTPELILIAKDDIEANNPFNENDNHILS